MRKSFKTTAQGTKPKKPFDKLEKTDPARALMRYAELGDLAGVKRLLAQGLDPDEVISVNTGIETVEDTALYAAAGAGHLEIAEALIHAGADVNKKINDDETPIIHAAMNGWPNMVTLLVQHKAEVNHAESYDGYTALHWAARLGRSVTVEELLVAGADDTIKSKRGETARQMICAQIGMGKQEYQELYDAVEGAFLKGVATRERMAEKALRDRQKTAEAIAQAPVLQKQLTIKKPLRLKPPKG